MRNLICRFDDETAFLEGFTRDDTTDEPRLTCITDSGIPSGDVVRVAVIIDEPGERHDLHLRVVARTPTLSADTGDLRWRYDLAATSGDAPWLEMLREKFETSRRVSAPPVRDAS